MKSKRRWLLLILPLALFAWAYQVASWRPKLVGVQPTFAGNELKLISPTMMGREQNSLLISPNGRRLISRGQSNQEAFTIAWDVESRQKLWQQKGANSLAFPLAFSPDGRQLAVAIDKSVYGRPGLTLHLTDAATGKQSGPQILPAHYLGGLQGVAFLSNRELVVSTWQGASVIDTRTGKAIRQWRFELPPFRIVTPELPRKQSHVAADGTAMVALYAGELPANGILAPGEKYRKVTGVTVYDTKTGKRRGQWTYPAVFRNPRLSPDGTLWAMEPRNSDVPDFYDAKTGKRLWSPSYSASVSAPWAWSGDSQCVAVTLGSDVKIFDARTGRYLSKNFGNSTGQALALDPRGDYFYTLDNQGRIWRWRAR